MTPIQHATDVDRVLRYVAALLLCSPGSPEWRIGKQFALLNDAGRSRYLQDLLATADKDSRTGQIAAELQAIIRGTSESGAA